MKKDFIEKLSFDDFQKLKTPHELHNIADRCIFEIQEWIAESPLCSEATAMMIFWDTCPHEFFNYSWKAKAGSRIDDFNLIRTIVNNFEKGFYLKTDISYDPTEKISKIKFIPDVVLQVCNGETPYIYIDKKEVHSWFGDNLDNRINQCNSAIELYNIAVSLKQREISVYEKIIDHAFCDRAIAVIMYWLLDKYSNSTTYAQEWLTIEPILEKIVRKLENNEYPDVLAYDPNKEVKPVKWQIPDYLYKKIG